MPLDLCYYDVVIKKDFAEEIAFSFSAKKNLINSHMTSQVP